MVYWWSANEEGSSTNSTATRSAGPQSVPHHKASEANPAGSAIRGPETQQGMTIAEQMTCNDQHIVQALALVYPTGYYLSPVGYYLRPVQFGHHSHCCPPNARGQNFFFCFFILCASNACAKILKFGSNAFVRPIAPNFGTNRCVPNACAEFRRNRLCAPNILTKPRIFFQSGTEGL